jgi:hypothetical protein
VTLTYDPVTDVGRMRRTIPDKDLTAAVWTDEELASFLADEGDWRRGAALALETMAADTAYTGSVVQVGDLRVDGASAARAMLQRAKALREQADDSEASEGGLFDIAEQVVDPAGYHERIIDDLLRTSAP